MTTLTDYDAAYSLMRSKNRAYKLAGNKRDMEVLVDGPCDNEFTVMSLRDAIDGSFLYEWAV